MRSEDRNAGAGATGATVRRNPTHRHPLATGSDTVTGSGHGAVSSVRATATEGAPRRRRPAAQGDRIAPQGSSNPIPTRWGPQEAPHTGRRGRGGHPRALRGAGSLASLVPRRDMSGQALVRLAHVDLAAGAAESGERCDDGESATVLPFDGGPIEEAVRTQQLQVLDPEVVEGTSGDGRAAGPGWRVVAPRTSVTASPEGDAQPRGARRSPPARPYRLRGHRGHDRGGRLPAGADVRPGRSRRPWHRAPC